MSDTADQDILEGYKPAHVVAKTLNMTLRTLDKRGLGPAGRVKIGRQVYYHIETLRQGIAARVQTPVRGHFNRHSARSHQITG